MVHPEGKTLVVSISDKDRLMKNQSGPNWAIYLQIVLAPSGSSNRDETSQTTINGL